MRVFLPSDESPASATGSVAAVQAGMAALGLAVGVGAGLELSAFRELIVAFTWLRSTPTCPALGRSYPLLTPILGGLLYGP